MSARDMYDDYYNPGYQSYNSLATQEEIIDNSSDMIVATCEDNSNSNITNANHPNFNSSYQFSTSKESYYSTIQDEYEDDSLGKVKTLGGGCHAGGVTSPYFQQNTDSLESRDDELKDSFDTAISSRDSSSLLQIQNKRVDTTATVTTVNLQNNERLLVDIRDQINSPASETILPKHSLTNTSSISNNRKGFFNKQETIESVYYQAEEEDSIIDIEYADKLIEEPYLDPQESLESFTEEGTNGSIDYNNKAITRDSPVSVIHVEAYEEEEEEEVEDEQRELRRGSSQITVVDPYNVSTSRRPSMEPYRAASPRFELSAYDDAVLEDEYMVAPPVASRKNSGVDLYQGGGGGVSRRASVRRSPVTAQESVDLVLPVVVVGEEEPKDAGFEQHVEQDQEKTSRPKVTAKQRWLWAYNKIIMQLNVSKYFKIVSKNIQYEVTIFCNCESRKLKFYFLQNIKILDKI